MCEKFRNSNDQKILKSPGKKKLMKSNKSDFFPRKIAFLAVLNFFPVQKLNLAIFEIAKNGNWSKKFFCEIDLFDFTSFLAWTFFIFWPTVLYRASKTRISGTRSITILRYNNLGEYMIFLKILF